MADTTPDKGAELPNEREYQEIVDVLKKNEIKLDKHDIGVKQSLADQNKNIREELKKGTNKALEMNISKSNSTDSLLLTKF